MEIRNMPPQFPRGGYRYPPVIKRLPVVVCDDPLYWLTFGRGKPGWFTRAWLGRLAQRLRSQGQTAYRCLVLALLGLVLGSAVAAVATTPAQVEYIDWYERQFFDWHRDGYEQPAEPTDPKLLEWADMRSEEA